MLYSVKIVVEWAQLHLEFPTCIYRKQTALIFSQKFCSSKASCAHKDAGSQIIVSPKNDK